MHEYDNAKTNTSTPLQQKNTQTSIAQTTLIKGDNVPTLSDTDYIQLIHFLE